MMRHLPIASALLLAGCAASAHTQATMPRATIHYSDLALDTEVGQDALVARVQQSATDFCQAHGAEVTPHHVRYNKRFCPTNMRGELLRSMPPEVRRAYDAGQRRQQRLVRSADSPASDVSD